MNKDVSEQIAEILEDYVDEEKEKIEKVFEKVARDTAADLRSTSPKKSGDYRKGWAVKIMKGASGLYTAIVYNKKAPGLTHLLEHGHVVRNKWGTYGRAPAHPHIKPAQDEAIKELLERIKRL